MVRQLTTLIKAKTPHIHVGYAYPGVIDLGLVFEFEHCLD